MVFNSLVEATAAVAAVLAEPLLDAGSRTFWPALVVAALVALVHGRRRGLAEALGLRAWLAPSTRVDLGLLVVRQLLGLLLGAGWRLGGAALVATALVRNLDATFGRPATPELPLWLLGAGYSLVLFVAWDLSRYALHRAMHELGPLWQLHQVHHSAEVLTPLAFHRVHPLESALYGLRGLLVDGTLAGLAFFWFRGDAREVTLGGVHVIGFVASLATGNLRHSHVWLRFPAAVERWWLSPAQHQLHHGATSEANGSNYGTWLAVWDRLAGTLRLAPEAPPAVLGLPPEVLNHDPRSLSSALVGPVAAWVGRRGAVAVLLGAATRADAAAPEPEPDEADEPDAAYELVVVDEDGVPRVAGSAHVVTEEELDRYDASDIHQVLSRVPGVYVRGEDGYGLRPNIGLRGANSDRSAKVALMEDGIPLAPAPYAAPAAYYFPMTQRLVGVEVFKGPASVRFGPQTTGGAINLVTRATPDHPDGAAEVTFGQRTTLQANGWGGTGDDTWGLLLDGAHLSTDGFKELDGGGNTGFVRDDLMLKVRRSDGGGTRSTVELKLGYGREVSNETYLGLSLADAATDPWRRYAASQDDHLAWDRTQAELSWRVSGRAVEVRTVAWHHWQDRTWTKLNGFDGGPDLHDLLLAPEAGQSAVYLAILRGEEDSLTDDQALLVGTNHRTFHSGGAQSTVRWRVRTAAAANQLDAGLRLMLDDVVRVHTEDPFAMTAGDLVATGGATTTTLDAHTSAFAVATHAQDDLELGPVHLIPGARVEWIRTAAGTTATGPTDPDDRLALLPGFGTAVTARPWLDLFAGVHRGFSPVAPGEDPDTRPESSVAFELGARATPGETHAELVGFWSAYTNLTGQCTLSGGCADDQLDQQFDGGAAQVRGLEGVLEQRWHLPGRASLLTGATGTWTDGRFSSSFDSEFPQFGSVEAGDVLPYVPELQGGGQVALDHDLGSLAVACSGRSAMRDVAGQGEIPDTERVPGVLLVDLSAQWNVVRGVALRGKVNNVTDRRTIASYRPFGARPVAPLQVDVGVRIAPEPK